MQYRKKPVVIEAVPAESLIRAFRDNWSALPAWAAQAYDDGIIAVVTDEGLTIKTLEGDHFAHRADMVIRGVKGELYPCKPDIFAATYDAVRETGD
jgi:hypothetical protein